jgi:hypothetical protein
MLNKAWTDSEGDIVRQTKVVIDICIYNYQVQSHFFCNTDFDTMLKLWVLD